MVSSFDSEVVAVVEAGLDEFDGDEAEGARKGREVVRSRNCSGRTTYGVIGARVVRVVLLSRGAKRAWTKGDTGDEAVRQVDEASRNHAGAEIGGRAMLDGGLRNGVSSALVDDRI